MAEGPRAIVMGILPHPIATEHATQMVALAGAAVAALAAMGNQDLETLHKVLAHVGQSYNRLPPTAQDNVGAVAQELVSAVQAGKHLVIVGNCEGP